MSFLGPDVNPRNLFFTLLFIFGFIIFYFFVTNVTNTWKDELQNTVPEENVSNVCGGTAECFEGTVTNIIDGDTLEVNNDSIRLALVDCPEKNQSDYELAKSFASAVCPIGSIAIVDEDDKQTEGSYGRMIAAVNCNGRNLNEALLVVVRNCNISKSFCDKSEFGNSEWAKNHGC